MMNDVEKAVDKFNSGRNCSQSIICTYGPRYGVSEEKCLQLAAGFGGGMRRAEVCGAVSGSIMALGFGFNPRDSTGESKEKINKQVLEFIEKFEQKSGSILCRELLGCDISKPEGQLEAKTKKTSETICPGLVKSAAEILETMIS